MKAAQRGIQSVEVAGQILRVIVKQARPLTLKELADLVDIPAAQVYTYLVSLTRVGILKRNPFTQEFEPGHLSFRLGVAALYNLPKVREAIPHVDKLARRLELSVFLAVCSQHGPTVVRYVKHGAMLNLGFRLGTVMSLTRTATGRLFSAFQPQSLSEEIIGNQSFTRDSPDTFRSDVFQKDLEHIRVQGLSIARGFPTRSVSSICVPVFDAQGRLLITLTAFSSTTDLGEGRIAEVTDAMRHVANQLSEPTRSGLEQP